MFQKLFTSSAVVGALAALLTSHSMSAANNRSWVSSTGTDFNPCTREQPCRTFQAAHDATLPGGEVDVVDAGDFGMLTITKSMTIDGGKKAYIQVPPTDSGIQVNASPRDKVTIRNLSIHGGVGAAPGNGIYWTRGNILTIENVAINGFNEGIQAMLPGPTADQPLKGFLLIKDVIVQDTRIGIGLSSVNNAVDNGLQAVIERTVVEDAQQSAILTYTGKTTIRNSVLTRAGWAGVYTGVHNTVEVSVESTTIAHCYWGVNAQDGTLIRLRDVAIYDNQQSIEYVNPAKVLSFGDNRIEGNAVQPNLNGILTTK